MKSDSFGAVLTFVASLVTITASAQAPLIRLGPTRRHGRQSVAGDLTFGNFTLPPLPIVAPPPRDGVGDIAASAVVTPLLAAARLA